MQCQLWTLLQNFFTRKSLQWKSNIGRAKSVNKLDKKKIGNGANGDSDKLVGILQGFSLWILLLTFSYHVLHSYSTTSPQQYSIILCSDVMQMCFFRLFSFCLFVRIFLKMSSAFIYKYMFNLCSVMYTSINVYIFVN